MAPAGPEHRQPLPQETAVACLPLLLSNPGPPKGHGPKCVGVDATGLGGDRDSGVGEI